MITLDYDEVRAAYAAVKIFIRMHEKSDRPVPHQAEALYRRLDPVMMQPRTAVSPSRHETGGGETELSAWMGTRLAAQTLGWNARKVQRHSADLDGQLIGGRLWFPAASIETYRKALQSKEIEQ
ncbi:hypothetical protein [Mycobacterium sp. URHB0021]